MRHWSQPHCPQPPVLPLLLPREPPRLLPPREPPRSQPLLPQPPLLPQLQPPREPPLPLSGERARLILVKPFINLQMNVISTLFVPQTLAALTDLVVNHAALVETSMMIVALLGTETARVATSRLSAACSPTW